MTISNDFRPRPEGTAPSPSFAPGPSSFVATYDFFAEITQISNFFAFPNFRTVRKFAAYIKNPKTNCFSFRGALPPCPLSRGSAPRPPL